MKYQKATERRLDNPEVIINLWAYASEDGSIIRLAGKAYVMQGTDSEKLAILRQLSQTDFLSAPHQKVPTNFRVKYLDGSEMNGIAQASMMNNQQYNEHLFGPLIESLAKSIPEQLCSVNGEYQCFRLELPETPLCVTTLVMEHEDGTLVPMVSG